MIQPRSSIAGRIATSGPLLFALLATSVALVLFSAVRFQAPEILHQQKVLSDFDAFHIAGRLAAEGRVADAYHMEAMVAAQQAAYGTQSFMPWTYPPPFTLAMQRLSALPIGVAFTLFTLLSFAFYLWVLRRIAGPWFLGPVVAILPVIILNLRTGQNGFLVGGLIGAFLIAFRGQRIAAGIPLGLMIVKPHLAAGIGLATLLQRRWPVLAVGAAVGLALVGLSTWAYGLGIWLDFRDAVREAGAFLAAGYYPLYRMSSVYATAYTFGTGATVAMMLQALAAMVGLGLLGAACLRPIAYPRLAALICAASLFVSPYGYDYDLAILGIAFAFLAPELVERCNGRELFLGCALSWLACGFGFAWTTGMAVIGVAAQPVDPARSGLALALICPALLALCWYTTRLLIGHDRDSISARVQVPSEQG